MTGSLIPVLFYTSPACWASACGHRRSTSPCCGIALDFQLLRRGRFTSLAADPGPAGAVGAGVPLRLLHVPSAGAGYGRTR
ncbi:MAG: hypothetical protein ACLTYN_13645 [Dysosmobacter welbionis]